MQNYMRLSVSYSVIKMAGDSDITTLTRYIPIYVFTGAITNDIKNLISKYGHKNCGLMHKELCEEIKKIINTKKTLILGPMDEEGKEKWNNEWRSKKNEFLNKLFEEEEFINVCNPFKKIKHQDIYQLLSRHVKFCQKKDVWRAEVEANPEYNACREYDSWIETEKASFTLEYLRYVSKYHRPTVNGYFSTKEDPRGHDPRSTYHNSKLNCKLYIHSSKKNLQKPVDNASTKSLHPPTEPDPRKESQEIGGKSMPDRDGGITKNKPYGQILSQTEPPASNTQKSSQSNTKVDDDTANGQHTHLKAKGTGPPNNVQDAGIPTEVTDKQAKTPEQLPEPTISISPKDSTVANVPGTLSSVTKNQGTVSDSTPSTTLATSGTIHSNQNISSPSGPDLSLPESQSPAVVSVPSQHQTQGTSQYSKEPTTPDPIIKSTDKDASLTSPLDPHSPLDPGLVSAPATASNSSSSATLSATVSTTSASTAGSSSDQDILPITVTSQSTATTPTSATTVLTETTTSMLDPSTATVSAVGTKPTPNITRITGTTDEYGKPKASTKTVSDSPDPNFVSTKRQDDTIPPINVSSSDASDNLNMNQHPSQSLGTPPDPPLGSSPGLPSVLSADENILHKNKDSNYKMYLFTKISVGGNKIKASPKDAPQQSRDSTQDTSTPLSEGTRPSGKPSITPTNFPPLTSIIPTILIILATITLLSLLYKYTPFGLLLGRRRKRKKRDLRSTFVIPEESTYESPNIALHEWEDHNLLEQTVKNEEYVKLLKINRYKQEMQKRKKEKKKTLIEVHMEVLEEYKNEKWELHKGDFLEICLRGFINDENETYQKLPYSKLTINNIKNEKTIEDIQKQEILWNNWIENHRNILEQWKKEEWVLAFSKLTVF
ncbi:STP1 protein [Plasmodium ovale wallikeri]|uniref:STP1 protein n=1 Tax=Plasmodium ovale wallikeri TaxID=864142 RepID=A0A1A9AKK8_PLAOA|nr:STP1 protein [Plasmodium ovale wallikeri]